MAGSIAKLFPLGGPVPSELVVGRAGERNELAGRLREGMSTMLVGPRRAGKTTVCGAVCETLAREGFEIFDVEVPERADSTALLQLVLDRAMRMARRDEAGVVARTVRPMIEGFLKEKGIPLDLAALDPDDTAPDALAILGLPLEVARQCGRPVVFFLDELQRAVSYEDGLGTLTDIVDLYTSADEVVVLVDGSEERTLDDMLGRPLHFGKLVDRLLLDPRIAPATWREPLTGRFAEAGLELPDDQRERLLRWSDGLAYSTMAAARFTAFSARKTGTVRIADFDLDMGLDEARRHLEDDGV